jgi:hypothetical protein
MFLLLNRLFNNDISCATATIKHRKNELWWDKEWALNLNGELEHHEEESREWGPAAVALGRNILHLPFIFQRLHLL